MTALEDIIKAEILDGGAMGVDRFMALALGHPVHGYYMKKDPFGVAGDFTTAPEISQMFGEMTGLWIADIWQQMGQPARFRLVECGAGRATLMADILRACQNIHGFLSAVSIDIVDISPVLRERQRQTLSAFPHVRWHDDITALPPDMPVVVIGNEFLDALPVRQWVGDEERRIVYDENDKTLKFSHGAEAVHETSPARDAFMRDVAGLLKSAGGAALFMDYGHEKTSAGDTLQAVYRHEYCDVLKHIGDADITAHVDFESIRNTAAACGLDCFGLTGQGTFLRNMGIELRAQALRKNADAKQTKDIDAALHRLTHPDEMGKLFKVTGFGYGYDFTPAGLRI